ncbi:hypothetical protein FA13DRAFT_825422 [Coprinellus micaceus]|uniref:Uncharacterized protein n=1 Tax=Coprinellus micaceus TaxID=71717 RepID=A0A4Y7T1X0_COPMI|nr:hypothetical protein FA13DRAFT_825422 [Coprinellus micaceus]
MSVLDLEHAATAPRRFRSLIQHRDVDEVPLPYSHRQLFFRRAPPLTGTYNVDGLFLIPGGRFMISMSGETLNLWDVGYNMNIPPSAYPLATADNCGRLYALCRTPDGKGVFLASKKTSGSIDSQATVLQIYGVRLAGDMDNSPPEFTLKARLDLGFPVDQAFTIRLCPSMALIRLRSHIAIWDWAQNTGCKWSSPILDDSNRPVRIHGISSELPVLIAPRLPTVAACVRTNSSYM